MKRARRTRSFEQPVTGSVTTESDSAFEAIFQVGSTICGDESFAAITHIVFDRKLREAIDALPVQRRYLMRLAFFEDLTHSQIAGRTGIPLGTIKTHMRRSLAQLKTALN